MARNQTWMPVEPEAVFAVLADPYPYADWVVGAHRIRDADPGWPGLGTKLYHQVGRPPLGTRDFTRVIGVDPPHRLVLDAVARPFGMARVCLELRARDGGTLVTFYEDPAGWVKPLRFLPPVQLLTRIRNAESLRRLERLALERRSAGAPAVTWPATTSSSC